MKSDPNLSERALGKVLAEARAEGAPELDWERIQQRIDEASLKSHAEPSPTRSRAVRAGLFLAAASLLLAIGWVAAGGRAPDVARNVPIVPRVALDGNALAASSRIDATAEEVAVEHARHSYWTLERGGRATVNSAGGVVRIELHAGSLVARVVPSAKPETFVVEAAGTRVAVHGTAFRVALTTDHLEVAVMEGTVLVGPRTTPGTGQPISAHESSSFTLDGVPVDKGQSASAEKTRPRGERRGSPSLEKTKGVVEQPSIDDVEKVVSQVLELGSTCFRSRTASANGVRVTASTTVTLRALPSGGLELASLDPPLAPPVQTCIAEGVGKLSTAESQRGISIVRRMDLEQ